MSAPPKLTDEQIEQWRRSRPRYPWWGEFINHYTVGFLLLLIVRGCT